MSSQRQSMGYQQGLSLVELMIAMTLGLILLAGLTQIFVSNKQAFVLSQAQAAVQESGREAAMLLGRDIRNADYWGCLTRNSRIASNLNPVAADSLLNFEQGLQIAADTDSQNNVIDGSHVITLRGIDPSAAMTVAKMPAANAAALHLTDASGVQPGDLLLVSDCESANLFQATNVNTNVVVHNRGNRVSPGNAVKLMPRKYSDNARVLRPSVVRYSVQLRADGGRSLMLERPRLQGNGGTAGSAVDAIEMVTGVRDLRTLIGVDNDGDGAIDAWQDPPAANAVNAADLLDRTLAVRVSVLARSNDDRVLDAPVTVCFPGWLDCSSSANGLVTADDRALYRVYTFVASLRNRTLEQSL
ncbi:MAG: PilW family protein [Marinobacter sp.]|uniref:PilW family protein n=1 Tax=Marinobacter sp. TaxID=50741 RepID=UPI00299EBF2E|nr:PilW family protein [Marinobacter sp.]MDX1634643.1 PilW family protein [Marinobacter sp.]